MATETQTVPELTIVNRIHQIPLIASSLDTINATLEKNAYTHSPYTAAKGLSYSTYEYTKPIQIRLAPLLSVADTYANKAVDLVENRYPYPFRVKPDEVANLVKERRESATQFVRQRQDSVTHTIDEKVKKPAHNVAQGLDHQLAPLVDYLEVAVTKLNKSESQPPSPTDSQYQYQRALALSKNLKDSLYVMSNEQLKQLHDSSVLVQKATETAQSITNLASSSLQNAQTRIHALSDTMVTDLKKVQCTLSQDFADINTLLSNATNELKSILTRKDLPLNEKVSKIGAEVKERVNPLLESAMNRVKEMVAVLAKRGEEAVDSAKKTTGNDANGRGNGHPSRT